MNVQLRSDPPQSVRDDPQVPLPVVRLLGGEEGQVEVPEVVENGAAAASPAGQRDPRPPHGRQVALTPGVLMAPDDHSRLVPPQQQDAALLQVHICLNPVLQCQVLVHVRGPGLQDQTSITAADGGGGAAS